MQTAWNLKKVKNKAGHMEATAGLALRLRIAQKMGVWSLVPLAALPAYPLPSTAVVPADGKEGQEASVVIE